MIIKQAELLDERGKRLIGKYLLGGVAAGGSAALATSLINYYNMLREEAARKTDTSQDDDILYLTMRNSNAPKKVDGTQQPKTASIAGGLAITGGALAGMGTYALVRKLYQKYKKQRLQQQLDQAQQGFFDVVSQEASAEKRAAQGKPMGGLEFATSMPVTLTLLAALASGALTHKALEKTFPRPKKPVTQNPRKIVLRKQEEPSYYDTVEEEEDNEKAASYDTRNSADTYEDGLELLVHMCLGHEKVASVSDLTNLVGAVLDGRRDEVIDNTMSIGFDAAMDLCKGAYENVKQASPQQIGLAVSSLVKTPELQPITAVLAAGEYEDLAPHFCKAAGTQPEEIKEMLCKVAGVLGAFGRSQLFSDSQLSIKSAAMLPAQGPPVSLEELLMLLEQAQQEGGVEGTQEDENPEDQQTLLSTDSESSEEAMKGQDGGDNQQKNKPKVVKHKSVTVEADPKDEIDDVLNTGKF